MKRFKKIVGIGIILAMCVGNTVPYFADNGVMNQRVDLDLYADGELQIVNCMPWVETAVIKWQAINGVSDYDVFYKEDSESEYTKVDEELVRIDSDDAGNWRVDVLGLKGNTKYNIKIVPVGMEDAQKVVEVVPYKADRSGYAFSDPDNPTTGGYNPDGTVREDAEIIYLTPENNGSVALKAAPDKVGFDQIIKYISKNPDTAPPVIFRFIGNFTSLDGQSNRAYKLKRLTDVTFEGVGNSGFTQMGFEISGSDSDFFAHNIEIKNLYFKDYADDGVCVTWGAERVWIHNCYFGSGKDGACDVKKAANNVTISYNICEGADKAMLCGHSDDWASTDQGKLKVTYHHNYYKSSRQRNPRVRFGEVHVYNNYYENVGLYCVGSACDAQVYVENNYFLNSQRPTIVSKQGHAVAPDVESKHGGNLLSTSSAGLLKVSGNYMENCQNYDESVDTKTDGFTFSPALCYSYVADTPDKAKENVLKLAGTVLQAKDVENMPSVEPTTQTTTNKPVETSTQTTTEVNTETTTIGPGMMGDVNSDDVLTAADGANILSYVLNSDKFELKNIEVANVDGNPGITASDAATVLAKVLNNDFIF